MGDAEGDEVGFDRVEGEGEVEFADVCFDSDFPEGDDADVNDGGGFDEVAGGGWELEVIFEELD